MSPDPPLSGISELSFDSIFLSALVILPSPVAPSVFFFYLWPSLLSPEIVFNCFAENCMAVISSCVLAARSLRDKLAGLWHWH